ncbi:MAG: hypothetical protein GWM92_16645, partial [Gemmatimonadetes bacterium]|nr:hypothetical protein [Gemmatimonadota bacterium]NIR80393.1 hypothetical protein [Gemmatimonadota bacterium]NIT89153.1 hypothetical protein [Gemmatimonadota bacterium]NIU32953.1 hypothetical protein [Gemmatimonadota bacterium]NIU37345.1 hypothetical protein [Gemmatimonadota bacterium]
MHPSAERVSLRLRPVGLAALLAALLAAPGESQELTVERLFSGELFPDGVPVTSWTPDGSRLTFLQRNRRGEGTDLVAEDVRTGSREVLVDGGDLVPPGEDAPVAIEDYRWSPDGTRLLIFAETEYVWR